MAHLLGTGVEKSSGFVLVKKPNIFHENRVRLPRQRGSGGEGKQSGGGAADAFSPPASRTSSALTVFFPFR